MSWREKLRDARRAYTRPVEAGIVWLDGSKDPSGPIRRRWRLQVYGWVVLSVPVTTVEWSR